MGPLENFLPNLPLPFTVILFTVIGLMGALALIYSVLLEAERRQDAVIVVATASLFVYALFIGDKVFMFAMGGMFLIALRELVQIMRGKHHHSTNQVNTYSHPETKNS